MAREADQNVQCQQHMEQGASTAHSGLQPHHHVQEPLGHRAVIRKKQAQLQEKGPFPPPSHPYHFSLHMRLEGGKT